MRIVVGMTGASGAAFGVEFLRRCTAEKYLIVTKWGRYVLKEETGLTEHHLAEHVKKSFADEDMTSPFASGLPPFDALVIIPCSTSTMGKIASGLGDTLLTRAAAVALKERRKVILVLREAPLSTLSLKQAYELSQMGVILMPLSPPMYHNPKTLEELITQFADKVIGECGLETAFAWRPEALE